MPSEYFDRMDRELPDFRRAPEFTERDRIDMARKDEREGMTRPTLDEREQSSQRDLP